MKVFKTTKRTIQGVPDYFSVYRSWILRYMQTGNNQAKVNAYHYARVAEEFGQAIIEDDTTMEVLLENR